MSRTLNTRMFSIRSESESALCSSERRCVAVWYRSLVMGRRQGPSGRPAGRR